MHMKKGIIGIIFMALFLLASGCDRGFQANYDEYMGDMSTIHELDEEFNEKINQIDLEALVEETSARDPEVDLDKLSSLNDMLSEEVEPLIEEMNTEMEQVEVVEEDLREIHETYKESLELKGKFVDELNGYVETYYKSALSNETLIELSQTFMENQEERDQVIEDLRKGEEGGETDELIKQINSNSEELDGKSEQLKQNEPRDDRTTYINEVILPLVDRHIRSLNQVNLETEIAMQVRSLTLEMYYGFEKYYQERTKAMEYNEQLQQLQLQNILPYKSTYSQLDDQYWKGLKEIEDGL
ncbi:EMYY motif lipoprotein [Salinicoccus siamensis]|uniref:EMYY motif lipoprotein n=1 Tax=Salinicoccus siamensis TaxID=381830 RepID=A0ABV5Z0I0_9STAP